VRDIEGLEAVGVPVFARGLSPNSPLKNGPGEIGRQIAIGRVAINAGDIVIGDRDGVVIVAREDADAVLSRMSGVLEKERSMEASVAGGTKYPAWLDDTLSGKDIEFLD
jgi:4-hydroxy-4-methyl-2-oxoglutarate aldolase